MRYIDELQRFLNFATRKDNANYRHVICCASNYQVEGLFAILQYDFRVVTSVPYFGADKLEAFNEGRANVLLGTPNKLLVGYHLHGYQPIAFWTFQCALTADECLQFKARRWGTTRWNEDVFILEKNDSINL